MGSPAESPLLEAETSSLDELFSRDPEGYNERDIERVIQEYRRSFAAFQQAEEKGERVKTPKTPKVKETMSLKDLGLT